MQCFVEEVQVAEQRFSFFLTGVSPEVRFKKIICNSTDPQIYFEKCYLTKVNKSTTTLTMHQKLLQPIYSAYCNISVIQLSNSLNRVWYKFTNIDACGFFKKRRNAVLSILFSTFQEFSNINHTCPYKDYLIFNDLAIDDRKLAPIPAFPGDYVLQTDWRLNGKNTAQVIVFIHYTRNGLKYK
ncbi:uncharacterized protein LOC115066035 [Bactrocera dorsalis]|uniref:Uncharacterized protein LOC115066035 n=1 Tax=Bactrocera dorsalis TaxID=27457 RepID=A0ABM3JHG1_BACDO|nr:uncharacterized protein LOC115066035 [Bactrocera dorsalis]